MSDSPPPGPVRIAGLQTSGTPGDVAANLAELERAARRAAERGAQLLITPELFVTGYDIGAQEVARLARQDLLGPVRRIAADTGLAIVLGAPEADGEDVYNSAFFVDDTGEVTGRYRKTHLFGELDRRTFAPGHDLVHVVEHRGLRIALLICYDVEFGEAVRAAARAGAHLVAVPTAQMEPFAFVAEHVIRTRAWENQVYVAYVNHDGVEGGTTYVGRSSVVAPSGDVLDSVVHGDHLLVADVDPAVVADAQRRNPYLTDLRSDLYARHAEQFPHTP